jgi:putative transposase
LTATFTALTEAGIARRAAAALTGMSRASMDRAARRDASRVTPLAPQKAAPPANQLTAAERARVLALLHSEEFIDVPPAQVYATLLGRGEYVCSISTMYRVLRDADEVRERRRQARHAARVRPELVATGPGQVYTWDITKLAGPARGRWFDAYVMIDIFSRYIVGMHVHAHESAPLAAEMMREVFGVHGIPQVVHADRGTSMTSKTVAELLEDLGVVRSHSRPRVSNDNPFSEAWFKTLKYAPAFPDKFSSLADARAHMERFVGWYNAEHHHAGIGLHTPADVHTGRTATVAAIRAAAMDAARQAHPERFRAAPDLPKILDLPESAWINEPAREQPETQAA